MIAPIRITHEMIWDPPGQSMNDAQLRRLRFLYVAQPTRPFWEILLLPKIVKTMSDIAKRARRGAVAGEQLDQ